MRKTSLFLLIVSTLLIWGLTDAFLLTSEPKNFERVTLSKKRISKSRHIINSKRYQHVRLPSHFKSAHERFHAEMAIKSKMFALRRSAASLDHISLKNVQNYEYFGSIQSGSSSQNQFNVIFDTGSSWLWLADSQCAEMCLASGILDLYNCSASASCFKQPQSHGIQYGRGFVMGTIAKEQISLGSDVLINQSLLLVQTIQDLEGLAADGVLGLSPSQSDMLNYSTVLHTMKAQHLINRTAFSIYLTEGDLSIGSQLVIGGYDRSLAASNFTFHPLVKSDLWVLKLDGLSMGNGDLAPSSNYVMIDSGTSIIVLDITSTLSFLQQLLNQGIQCQILVELENRIACEVSDGSILSEDNLPDLNLQINGTSYSLEAKYWVTKCGNFDAMNPNASLCLLDVAMLDRVPMIILGDSWFRKYYTVFSEEDHTIGFALAAPPKSLMSSMQFILIIACPTVAAFALALWLAVRKFKRTYIILKEEGPKEVEEEETQIEVAKSATVDNMKIEVTHK